MKKTLFLIFYLLIIISCNRNSDNINSSDCKYNLSKGKEIKFNDDICKFISDFMKDRNRADCIYEFYIDKKTADEYFLTMYNFPNDSNYFRTHYPLLYTVVDGHSVFVYSGVEDFINKEDYSTTLKIQQNESGKDISYETVSKVIKRDTSYIVGHIGLPFTNVEFLPPVKASE